VTRRRPVEKPQEGPDNDEESKEGSAEEPSEDEETEDEGEETGESKEPESEPEPRRTSRHLGAHNQRTVLPAPEGSAPRPESGVGSKTSGVCPYCKTEPEYFEYSKVKKGWAKCSNCGKFSRTRDLPPDKVRTVRKLSRSVTEGDEEEGEGEDDRQGQGEEGRAEPLFRTPTPAHVLLKKILQEYKVKPHVVERIVARCERMGVMDPNELGRMLMDMASGIKESEASYVVEEYDIALKNEEQRTRDIESRRTVYPTRRSSDYRPSTSSYSPRSTSEGSRFFESGKTSFTAEEVMRMMDERDREAERRRQDQEREREARDNHEILRDLQEEIRDLRENPPVIDDPDVLTRKDLAEAQNATLVEALKMQLENARSDAQRARDEMKEMMREHREDMKEFRDTSTKQIEKLQTEVKDEQKRALSRPPTEGFQGDEARLAADGLHQIADVMKSRGSLTENLAKIIPQLEKLTRGAQAPGAGSRPEDTGEPSVADLMDPKFVK